MSPAPRIKVLHVIDEFQHAQAGTERQLFHLLAHLDRARFEPEVAVLRSTPFTEAGRLPCPVHVWNIHKLARPGTLVRMAGIARHVARDGVRVANLYFNDTAVLAPWFLKRAGIAVIASRRDMGFWHTPTIRQLLRFNARYIDALIANSPAVLQQVCHDEGIAPERGVVIENALLQPIDSSSPLPLPLCLQGRPVVGIVANVRPVKRVDDLVRAFARVRQKAGEAVLVVVGGGDVRGLQTLGSSLGLGDSVYFTGAVADAVPWIKAFDVAVLCSASEGLSNSIIEYMACGKPVVATDTGGNPHLVRDTETGYLVPVGDVPTLADRILQLLLNPALARRFGEAGRHEAAVRFDRDTMVRAHAALYERLGSA